jgi:hypothetical protein
MVCCQIVKIKNVEYSLFRFDLFIFIDNVDSNIGKSERDIEDKKEQRNKIDIMRLLHVPKIERKPSEVSSEIRDIFIRTSVNSRSFQKSSSFARSNYTVITDSIGAK